MEIYVRFISVEEFNLLMLCGICGLHWDYYCPNLYWATDVLGGTKYPNGGA